MNKPDPPLLYIYIYIYTIYLQEIKFGHHNLNFTTNSQHERGKLSSMLSLVCLLVPLHEFYQPVILRSNPWQFNCAGLILQFLRTFLNLKFHKYTSRSYCLLDMIFIAVFTNTRQPSINQNLNDCV